MRWDIRIVRHSSGSAVSNRLLPILALTALLAATVALAPPRAGAEGAGYFVAPYGNDSGDGSMGSPWATIERGLTALQPGDTLFLRGGTYVEFVDYPEVNDGTSGARITVKAFQDERPVIVGKFHMKGADYWTYDGVNVTWDPVTGQSNDYLVKLKNGTGWVFTNAEVWGAHSLGAVKVVGDATDWTLSWLYVHDTYPTNDEDSDNLVVVTTEDGKGIVERCLLVNSENGRAVRIGPKREHGNKTTNVTVRYNTMYNNLGPSNVQIFHRAYGNDVHHNIMVTAKPLNSNVRKWELTGRSNVTEDNVGWDSKGVVANDPLVDGGGNRHIDPMFVDPEGGDFRPTNPDAQSYGVFASGDPEPEPEPDPEAAFRAFTDTSYWNTPLPDDAPVDPNSADILDWIEANGTTSYIRLSGADSTGDWGQPMYWADGDDPVYRITQTQYTLPDEFKNPGIRIPMEANADDTTDASLTVYDVGAGYVAWLWDTNYNSSEDSWSAGGGSIHYLDSNGLDGDWMEFPDTDPRNQGHRGVPGASFPVRWDEIEAGLIDHVLKIGVNTTKCEHVFPMVGDECGTHATDAAPEGTRIRIKPSIDLSRYDLSPAALVIARALQEYGAVIGDQSGGPVSLKVENTIAEGLGFLWDGVLDSGSLSDIPLDDFQVIELGYSPPSAR